MTHVRADPVDLVVANILSSIIRPLLPAFRESLGGSPEGRLIVSDVGQHHVVVLSAPEGGP